MADASQTGAAGATSGTEAVAQEPSYVAVTKRIANPMHLGLWKTSPACTTLKGFILKLNAVCKGTRTSDACHESESTLALLGVLDQLSTLIDETPCTTQSQRFGNTAFREWHAKVAKASGEMIQTVLPEGKGAAAVELDGYFLDAFGNPTRIDYGSGHELAFVAFLCCLAILEVFEEKDFKALVSKVFTRYLELVRKVQRVYSLEPAGSHGVWGLDDHQFLCYLWGSSQCLRGDIETLPEDIGSEERAKKYAEHNLFFAAVDNIFQVKTGPFFEHSRYLYDMSSVPSWKKINTGLSKMFEAEVLYKFPVIQHFLFGSLLSIDLPPVATMPRTTFPGGATGIPGGPTGFPGRATGVPGGPVGFPGRATGAPGGPTRFPQPPPVPPPIASDVPPSVTGAVTPH